MLNKIKFYNNVNIYDYPVTDYDKLLVDQKLFNIKRRFREHKKLALCYAVREAYHVSNDISNIKLRCYIRDLLTELAVRAHRLAAILIAAKNIYVHGKVPIDPELSNKLSELSKTYNIYVWNGDSRFARNISQESNMKINYLLILSEKTS